MGRFISADSQLNEGELGLNMFAYCDNNPVNNFDPEGYWKMPSWLKVTIGAAIIVSLAVLTVATCGTMAIIMGGALTGAIIGGTAGAISGYKKGGWSGAANGFMKGTISGGASGALAASGGGYLAQAVGNALINVGTNIIGKFANDKVNEITLNSIGYDAASGAISGMIGGRGLLSSRGTLPAAINAFDRTVAREIRRENAKYGTKVIAKALIEYKSAWTKNVTSTVTRYIGGTGYLNILPGE